MAQLEELEDRWLLPIEGRKVTQVCFDYALTPRCTELHSSYDAKIGGSATLESGDETWALSPEGDPNSMAPALSLSRAVVKSAIALKDGSLDMSFLEGYRLRVPVDDQFEAWEFVGRDGFRLVSLPGGQLAVWSEDR